MVACIYNNKFLVVVATTVGLIPMQVMAGEIVNRGNHSAVNDCDGSGGDGGNHGDNGFDDGGDIGSAAGCDGGVIRW